VRWVRSLQFSKKFCPYFPPEKVQKWVQITFAGRQIVLFDLDRTHSPSDTPIPIGSHSFSIGSYPFSIGSHPFLTESHPLKKKLKMKSNKIQLFFGSDEYALIND
jgi:hypothetical protein